MKTPHAIFAGLALIALAIATVGMSGRAGADAEGFGHYAVAAGSAFYTVLDTNAGNVRVCIVNGVCQNQPGK